MLRLKPRSAITFLKGTVSFLVRDPEEVKR